MRWGIPDANTVRLIEEYNAAETRDHAQIAWLAAVDSRLRECWRLQQQRTLNGRESVPIELWDEILDLRLEVVKGNDDTSE